ncbi:MAG: hypothetical protein GX799_09950 [Crenarchaeota archaeon]|nr:hypothetical protein [Thermoproteota archaeon]
MLTLSSGQEKTTSTSTAQPANGTNNAKTIKTAELLDPISSEGIYTLKTPKNTIHNHQNL